MSLTPVSNSPLTKDPKSYRPTKGGPITDWIASRMASSTAATVGSNAEGYPLTPQL
jgi:hypothetical protein